MPTMQFSLSAAQKKGVIMASIGLEYWMGQGLASQFIAEERKWEMRKSPFTSSPHQVFILVGGYRFPGPVLYPTHIPGTFVRYRSDICDNVTSREKEREWNSYMKCK
jgi:hypothetical protein